MSDVLLVVAVAALWVVLTSWVLPRLGVPT